MDPNPDRLAIFHEALAVCVDLDVIPHALVWEFDDCGVRVQIGSGGRSLRDLLRDHEGVVFLVSPADGSAYVGIRVGRALVWDAMPGVTGYAVGDAYRLVGERGAK